MRKRGTKTGICIPKMVSYSASLRARIQKFRQMMEKLGKGQEVDYWIQEMKQGTWGKFA
jgi:hypothetical protein